MRTLPALLVAVTLATACAKPAAAPETGAIETAATDSTAHLAHDAYTAAINANNIDSIMTMLTDDVTFLAPNEKPYRGKAALRPWLEGYLAAFTTNWKKTVTEFVVAGEWAFEQYDYVSTDTPKAGGDPIVGTGWGLLIYHRDADGKWRVARDAWGSDQPAKP